MYGRIDDKGKFTPARSKVTREGDKTIIEPMSAEELAEGCYKKVYEFHSSGRPGPATRPQFAYEDKGDYILKTITWVEKNPPAGKES